MSEADLFNAAAESRAYDSGRPFSQELAELRFPKPEIPNYGLFASREVAYLDAADAAPRAFVVEGERFDALISVRRLSKGAR